MLANACPRASFAYTHIDPVLKGVDKSCISALHSSGLTAGIHYQLTEQVTHHSPLVARLDLPNFSSGPDFTFFNRLVNRSNVDSADLLYTFQHGHLLDDGVGDRFINADRGERERSFPDPSKCERTDVDTIASEDLPD